MKVLNKTEEKFEVKITIEELLTIHQALNEVCNGITVIDFSTSLEATREEALYLMKQTEEIIRQSQENSQLN